MIKFFLIAMMLIPFPLFAQFGGDYNDQFHPPKRRSSFPNRYIFNPRGKKNTAYFHKRVARPNWKERKQNNRPYNLKTDSYCIQRSYASICN